jgi:hypothetical protein
VVQHGRIGLVGFGHDTGQDPNARTLLVNLPDPAGAAAEMVRLARPGG